MRIGPAVHRFRWFILGAWLAVMGAMGLLVGGLDPAANERTSFLPDWADHSRAVRALYESFPRSAGLSEAVVVFERPEARLTDDDFGAIERVAEAIRRPDPPAVRASDLDGLTLRSPADLPRAGNLLCSRDGKAALIVVNVPANFVTVRSARIVDHIRNVVAGADLPKGLAASVTGSSGFGHDYAAAAERSHRRALLVTVVAVTCILLLVYRSPVAAMVPLVAISVAAFVAMKVLAVTQHFGMHVGTGEKVFVFVLLYGAGTDYSLLFISRYREFLDAAASTGQAVAAGLSATFPAILASAGTDTAGLLMLCFADYGVYQTAGPAIAVALIIALLAAVTLVPALVSLCGRRLFWPGGRMGQIGRRWLWPRVARIVTARPGLVLAITVALMAVPAAQNLRMPWVYDALTQLKPNAPRGVGNAAAGIKAAERHWPVGHVAPVTILLRSDRPLSVARWQEVSDRLTEAVGRVKAVREVRSLTEPTGKRGGPIVRFSLRVARALGAGTPGQAREEYLSADLRAMRLKAVLDEPALTLAAMDRVKQIRDAVARAADAAGIDPKIHIAGATAEMIDIRKVAHHDFYRVAVLVLGVIFLMVFALLRDAILSAFMVGATVLSYLATLGLSFWFFAATGAPGLDWKVEIFLFVVMVAVGVDYSIFLAARLAQETARASVAEATRRAVIHTGPVISSCGVIMAATLGSTMAGELKLLVQLGFALALGMLIDTFVVRPLLLPAFVALTKRTGRMGRTLK